MQILSDDAETPISLSDVTDVVLKLHDPDTGDEKYSIPCTLVYADNGVLEYDPSSIDVGIYERKFVLTFTDGSVLVIPNSHQEYIAVWR